MKNKIYTVLCESSVRKLLKKIKSERGNLELRADFVKDIKTENLPALAGSRAIFTCRAKSEGGVFAGGEKGRVSLLKSALKENFKYVDIELKTIQKNKLKFSPAERKKLLISYHDFKKTPPARALEKIKNDMLVHKPAALKIALKINKKAEILQLTRFLIDTINERVDIILIGMGEAGVPTRIFFPLLGSAAAYAPDCAQTAPGQLTKKEMLDIYKRLKI